MKKILVAEDEQNIREFVVINLKRAGYDCVEAASGEEALRVYEQAGGDFDVAVLDIMMPGSLDGLAVCKELRQKNATIGIIMLTAKTQDAWRAWTPFTAVWHSLREPQSRISPKSCAPAASC